MKTVTFKSDTNSKINLLIKVAKEMGFEKYTVHELNDDKMELHSSKISNDIWIAKEGGERIGVVKNKPVPPRKEKK